MSIPAGIKTNFQTLLRAAEEGALALMVCKDAKTNEPRYVLCAVNRERNDDYSFVPFGHMASDGNPYEAYIPPEANA